MLHRSRVRFACALGLAALSIAAQPALAQAAQCELPSTAQGARAPAEPGKVFDNLFYLGGANAGAWALKTSDGVILVDALHKAEEARSLIESGLPGFGLEPRQVRYVVVTHGLRDNYAGAAYFVDRYKSHVVMSDANWRLVPARRDSANAPPPLQRDLSVGDRDWIALGDTKLWFYLTPGHRGGPLSTVFEVKAGARTHKALLWGGNASDFDKSLSRRETLENLEVFIAATKRMSAVAQRQGVDVLIAGQPVIMGTPNVVRALQGMGECAMAARDRLMPQP